MICMQLIRNSCICMSTLMTSVTYRFTEHAVRVNIHLKVAEVKYNVSVFLLVTLVPQLENSRDKIREAQKLSDDCVSSGNDPEDGLTTQVVLCQKVHHGA